MNFSDMLKTLRKNRGYTQKNLADILNVSQNAIYNWENGKRQPSIEMLEKIAEHFGVTVDYLIGITPEEFDAACDYALKVIAKTSNAEKTDFITNPVLSSTHRALLEVFTDDLTVEELEEIRKFAEFVKAKRK